jgi:hypothetical protein
MSSTLTDRDQSEESAFPGGPQRRSDGRLASLGDWAKTHSWLVTGVFLALWVLVLTPLSRALEWDEAVFVSQSGPIDDARHVGAASYVASREYGTPSAIMLLRRFLPEDLALLRFVWAVVMFAAVLGAFRLVADRLGRTAALCGLVIFVTWWVPTIFFGSFFGSLLGASAALASTCLYLRVRVEAPDRIVTGLALGAALTVMLWMRYLESFLVLVVLVIHALLWRPGSLLRRWRAFLAGLAVFVVGFVAPWMVIQQVRFGGVLGWLRASREQRSSNGGHGHPFGLTNGLGTYGRMFVGLGHHYPIRGGVPTWVQVFAAAGMLVLVALAVGFVLVSVKRAVAGRDESSTVVLLAAQSVVAFSVFWFLSGETRERYMLNGLIFFSAVAGAGLAELGGRLRRQRLRGVALLAGAMVAVVWASSQIWLANATQHNRVRDAGADAEIATTIHVLSARGPCLEMGKASKPQFQIRTGCRNAGRYYSLPWLKRKVRAAAWSARTSVFVLWTNGHPDLERLLQGWTRVTDPGHTKGMVLYYKLPSRAP